MVSYGLIDEELNAYLLASPYKVGFIGQFGNRYGNLPKDSRNIIELFRVGLSLKIDQPYLIFLSTLDLRDDSKLIYNSLV